MMCAGYRSWIKATVVEDREEVVSVRTYVLLLLRPRHRCVWSGLKKATVGYEGRIVWGCRTTRRMGV
jgi:hypothetical protein